jgi:ATP adenylyltransferase
MEVSYYNWWPKIISATQKAIAVKALHSIPTKSQIIEQNGIPFVIRIVNNLAKKDKTKKKQKKQAHFNPFLPYEQNLFVGDISETHLAILNKFNVVDYHLLIITRQFESQNSLLNFDDFFALWTILNEVEGLGFYNGGTLAGASQPHKHLQLVPYPLCQEIDKIPINNLILKHNHNNQIITIKELPFQHAITFFNHVEKKSPADLATETLHNYHQLAQKVNLSIKRDELSQDYNLLITREWMMIVPRQQDSFDSISVNSLGFAGALLVKNEADLVKIKQYQPLEILEKVAVSVSVTQ